jgi:CheY-like chemotaxis protein
MAYKLLLADDSVTIQRVIELTFADEDIEVITVGDGQQAIERIRADRPDIVLADVGMPERDGFEVAAFVKQNPDLCHIPVLLLTGAFEPVDEDRVRAVGCVGVLAKPFEPQLLIARVKDLLAAPASERKVPGRAPAMPDVGFDDRPLRVPPSTPAGAGEGLDELNLSANEAPDSRASLDEYFDRLDAAFATVGAPGEAPAPPASRPTDDRWLSQPADTGWIQPSPQLPPDRTPPPPQASRPAVRPAPPPRVITGVSPEIAAAFDWLLAAEQGGVPPPDALPPPGGSRSVAMNTIVDEVTRRVIERLADGAVRDRVAEIVSNVAERLVREEIERLKAGLK